MSRNYCKDFYVQCFNQKKTLDRSRTSLFGVHFTLSSFFLIHCDDILCGKYTLQKFGYNLVIAFGTVLAIKLYELTQFLRFVIRHMEAVLKQAIEVQ
jgi:hypothetical protein